MNAKNFRTVLEHIKAHPETYDQNRWCGTVCCLAGHAQRLAGKPSDRETVKKDAQVWLGLSRQLANRLFSPDTSITDLEAALRFYEQKPDFTNPLDAEYFAHNPYYA